MVSVTNGPNNQRTLDLQISDPVSMLNEIARRYESTERILMEYVDNGLDDAETLYRDHDGAYPYPIKIEVVIDFETRSVMIRDNCRGMEREVLERIIKNVGESQKRGLTWVNGRFGFGVQAFRAAADTIQFQTRRKDNAHFMLELQRDQHRGIQGARAIAQPFPSDTGTGSLVTINAFEEEWFETVTVESIKQEIESHFERLLARPNLIISVTEIGQEPVKCEPFRYRDIPGKAIQRVLELELKGETYPIEVHLKVADFEVPGRTVRFFARGRRINQVAEIKSFIRKSQYRTSVWGHPHLLGYIEVGEIVRPVITRDDFVRNKGRNIFYDAILSLEEDLKNGLDRINEAQRDTTLNRLEDVLRQVLDRLARQDRRQLRLYTASKRKAKSSQAENDPNANGANHQATNTGVFDRPGQGADSESASAPGLPASAPEFQSGTTWQFGGEGGAGSEGAASEGTAHWPETGGLGSSGTNFNESPETRPVAPTPGPDDDVNFSYDVEVAQMRPPPARRRQSFDIQFYDIPPDADGQVKRSYLVDATIYINVAHPDFQDRMTYTRQGQPKVSERLGAYIAAIISIHYKDQFYAKYGSMPERRDLLFEEQVDFIFRLESALREYLPELEKELARQKQQQTEAIV